MSRHSNPTVIGAFVVGAVVLVTTAFIVFGGSQVFAKKNRFVALFDEPTNGLRVGANVLLNGVRIGYVSDIDLLIRQEDFTTDTQVTLEILSEDYIVTSDGKPIDQEIADSIEHNVLIYEAGLRATLEVESFVTGQLRVELEFRPDTRAIMRSADPPYPEIPTIESNIQEIIHKVQNWFTDMQENVDLGALSQGLESVLTGVDELVRSTDLRETLAGLNRLVNDRELQQLAQDLQETLVDVRAAADRATALFESADQSIVDLVADVEPILQSLDDALDTAEQTLAIAREQLRGDSEQVYQLQATMTELERAARAVRDFFDYLERNPEALLRGKSE